MARKTQQAKGREILKKKSIYPEFQPLDYEGSLRRNLDFYNLEIDNSIKKVAFIAYFKKKGKDVTFISKLNDGWYSTSGAVAHMAERGIDLSTEHLTYLDKKYVEFSDRGKKVVEEEEPKKPVATKEDKADAEVSKHIAEFEGGVDLIYQGKSFDAKSYLLRNEVKAPIAKRIAEWFKPLLKELKDVDTDKQLQEAYSHLTRRKFLKLREEIESMVAACGVAAAIQKAARKPRAKKAKAPGAIAKKVKYMLEHAELKLKSVAPEKLVNTDEIWLFNGKTRKLFKYAALQGVKMSVKGTTITGFDPEKSGGKTLRKPAEQLKGVESMTSRPLNKLYNDVRAVPSKATGRINEDCLIVKCF